MLVFPVPYLLEGDFWDMMLKDVQLIEEIPTHGADPARFRFRFRLLLLQKIQIQALDLVLEFGPGGERFVWQGGTF